ncbi:hypothetical protein TRAPUB_5103 [Trametes pubescens]|uniref:Uncharacterized protein n=1 Tax=Trametes pubescens TaxID=154538 RepID=A0A1M2V9J3_TRAPU|nr:hypothetical protein TRAPUB_5103 [Trametes pubescens]
MRIGLSEVLTDGGEKGAGEAMSDPARALACIAVNVHISRTVDMDMASEQGTTCDDKTVSACHGDSEEASMVEVGDAV